MSEPQDINTEFAAFADRFREAVLDALGIPEEEKQMWRDLR